MKNPLIRRIPKELAAEWHKYLVIIVFMVIMIGVISGMYVGHDGMLDAVYSGREELNLEDGSFELTDKADEETLSAIEEGKKADVRTYYIDKATKEADEEVAEAVEEELQKQVKSAIESGVRAQCAAFGLTDETMIREMINTAMRENYNSALKTARNSADFKKAEEDAYKEAHDKVVEEVDKKWNEISDRYNLDDPKYFDVPVKIYENFYREEDEDVDGDGKKDATVRIFRSDSEINKASFLSGRAPERSDEIAIDRMHADNRGVKVGDTISLGEKKFTVVGLLSYVDYLTLHESNTDFMFDAFGFDVAMLTPEAFDSLTSRIHYNYAYKYKTTPEDKNAQADYSDSFRTMLITQSLVHDNELKDYLPEYLRQASNFAPNDIEGDSVGTSILCYILIGVIAFIFAVTISNTIEKEASVIGTLRASGYSKRELVVHYMSMPLIVTIIGAIVGNILGYTAFKDVAVNLYYNSYSLPTCHTVWSTTALIKTTVIPLVLMFFINLIVIVKKLQLSPLKFLRHDLAKHKKTKARRLPSWKFIRRFRLRVLFQNMPNYAILIFGVIFIELMLCFAFGLPDSLNKYAKDAPDMMFAEYQYMLMDSKDSDGNVITTSEESAEAFSSKSLMYPKSKDAFFAGRGSGGDEKVTVYGVKEDSKYVTLGSEAKDDNVFVSQAFINKFDLKVGDTITLKEEYENKDYTFKVAGIVDYTGGIAVFMDHKSFNKVFDYDDEDFSGYFSRNKITDIDSQDIAVVVTADDIIKVTVQLNHSMGGFMNVFKYALIILSAAMIYLLAKIIIERNEQAISMVKILGFKNGEIGSLYIVPTAIVVTVCTVIGFVAGYFLMVWIFKVFMLQMDGYFAFYLSPLSMILSMLYLLIGYMLVSVIDYIRIKHIPMDVALKNVD